MDDLWEDILQLLQSGEEIDDELLGLIEQFLESEEDVPPPPPPGIPQGADLLWVLSGANPEVFTQYLQTFPDPGLNALAANPTQLQQIIERFQRQITLPAGEVSEGIPKSDLQSSNIYGFAYDPRSKRLRVKFNGKDSLTSGPIYQYDGVPPAIFKMFQAGAVPAKTTGSNKWGSYWVGKIPSAGASFYQLIRQGGFPYRKVA